MGKCIAKVIYPFTEELDANIVQIEVPLALVNLFRPWNVLDY